MNKFDLNKLYIFSKEKYKLHNGKITPMAELLNNRIVNVENKYMGTITVDNEDYIVFPYNCNEISVEVYSDEEGNVYNEIEEEHVEDKQEKGYEMLFDSFLNKLFSIDLDNSEEEEDNSNEKYILKEGFISRDNPITSSLISMGLDDSEEEEEREDGRLDKFDLNKKYIFDKNLISNDIVVGDWVDRVNGREIDVKSPMLGFIYDEESDFNYFISPLWSKIKEDK